MERESIIPIIFMVAGFTIAKILFVDIGIIGAAIVGGVSAGIGAFVNDILTKFISNLKNKNDSYNIETNTVYKNDVEDEVASGIETDNSNEENFKPTSNYSTNNNLPSLDYVGFGGWLYLVVIGLVITFGSALFYLFDTLLPLINSHDWNLLTSPGNELYHPMWKIVIYVELIINLTTIVFIMIIGYMCYKYKKMFKYLMISYILVNLLFSIICFFMYQTIPLIAQESFYDSIEGIVRALVFAAIWIPYFLFSKRVKNTYIFK